MRKSAIEPEEEGCDCVKENERTAEESKSVSITFFMPSEDAEAPAPLATASSFSEAKGKEGCGSLDSQEVGGKKYEFQAVVELQAGLRDGRSDLIDSVVKMGLQDPTQVARQLEAAFMGVDSGEEYL